MNAACVLNTCVCNSGFTGDGVTCDIALPSMSKQCTQPPWSSDIYKFADLSFLRCAACTPACSMNAKCTAMNTCVCNYGFTGDGVTCAEIVLPCMSMSAKR
jgi:hypothetical protein